MDTLNRPFPRRLGRMLAVALLSPVMVLGTRGARADDPVRPPDAAILEQHPDFARLYNALSPTDTAKQQALEVFYKHRDTFAAYNAEAPQTVAAARTAMTELFAFVSPGGDGAESNLRSIHWLLKEGVIDEGLSRRMAGIRNDMVREVCQDLARKYGEIHRIDFSPATTLLSDIDQTFRAIGRLQEMGITGETLKAEFAALWQARYGVDPTFLDVVSHPHEARIPDWRQARPDVHTFVAELRKGSALLSDNPEAYFLEGAFRMQIDRRTYAGDQELYTIFAANPHDPNALVAKLAIVEVETGTARKYGYKIAPEARRSYAWGSSVGNWYFFVKHLQHDPEMAVRYAAKYGLRSFSEGPGWLILSQDPDPENLPSTYEELVRRPVERGDVLRKVYDEYYANRQAPLSFEELKWTMETALAIRAQKEDYRGEQRAAVLRQKAIELAGNEAAYRSNPEAWHAHVEELFKANMTKAFTHHIMVSLPERLHDWLDPHVDPRALGLTDEEIRNHDPRIEAAKKQLRTAALFETLHGLRMLDPADRVKAIERAKKDFQDHPVSRSGRPFGFQRVLDAVLKLALQDADPHLLMTDEAKRVRRTLSEGESRVRIHDDKTAAGLEEKIRTAQARFDALEKEFDAAFDAELRAPAGGDEPVAWRGAAKAAFKWALEDFKQRWDAAREGVSESMSEGFLAALDPAERTRLVTEYRRSLFDSLGFEFRKDWTAVEGIEPRRDLTWSPKKALGNIATLGNADSLINIIKAYRDSNGDPEAVGNTILMEVFSNLPVVGAALNFNAFLEGDLKAGIVLGVSFLYPGVGQVYLIYNVATGAYGLAADIATDSQVNMFYQGTLRNADMSIGPVNPNWVPENQRMFQGILQARLGQNFAVHRGRLRIEYEISQDPKRRKEIREQLADVYPENIRGMRNYMFLYYDRLLNRKLEGKYPQDEWDGRKLSDHLPPIRSNEPRDLRDPGNLPPMLKAFFGGIADDYMRGRGRFADLPEHQQAHQDRFLRRHFFHGEEYGNAELEAKATQLAVTLTAAFRDALLAKRQSGDTTANFDYRYGYEEDAAYIQPLVVGLTGKQVREEYPWIQEGTIADLPSILDIVPGETFAEKRKNFFSYFDGELTRRFEARARARRQPLPDDPRAWDHEKLGLKHADLRPIAAEERDVENPLLLAFFLSEVQAYFNDDTINHTDTGQANLSSLLTSRETIEKKLAQQMLRDYKIGLLQDIARRQQEKQQRLLEMRLPAVHAQQRLDQLVWGSDEEVRTPNRSEVLDALALHSGDPMISVEGPDRERAAEDPFTEWKGLFEADEPGAEIEIVGDIDSLKPRELIELKCQIRASRHYRRPFDVRWSIVDGRGSTVEPKPVKAGVPTNLQQLLVNLGNEPKPGDYTIRVEVFDSSPTRKKVGEATRRLSADVDTRDVRIARATNRTDSGTGMEEVSVRVQVGFPFWDQHISGIPYPGDSLKREKEVFWLQRVEYDGMTAITANRSREIPIPRNSLLEGDWDRHEVGVAAIAPVRRVGMIPAKVTIYTGPAGAPIFTHEFEIKSPTTAERKAQFANREPTTILQKRIKYEEEKLPKLREAVRDTRVRAHWLKNYEDLLYSERDYVTALWSEHTTPWLQESGRPHLDRLAGHLADFKGNLFEFGNATQVVEYVELVCKMYCRLGQIEEADGILQLLERHAHAAQGERAVKQAEVTMQGSNLGLAYREVAQAYALVRCDGEKALTVLQRSPYWKKHLADPARLGDKNKELLAAIDLAKAARQFFPAEAFSPPPAPGQRSGNR